MNFLKITLGRYSCTVISWGFQIAIPVALQGLTVVKSTVLVVGIRHRNANDSNRIVQTKVGILAATVGNIRM